MRIGLLPFVLMRSATVTFQARGDTVTPVKALFCRGPRQCRAEDPADGSLCAQVGLAFATSVGAWVNLALLYLVRYRARTSSRSTRVRSSVGKLVDRRRCARRRALCGEPSARAYLGVVAVPR